MSISLDDAVSRLTSQSNAVARLAQNEGGFSAVVAAFESRDPNAFRWVLDRLEMLPYCELICEWVRVKLCVLRCAEICTPPREDTPLPSLEQFARAVVQLASNEAALRRVVDAVACGNAQEYGDTLKELKLVEFCSIICHWVCGVEYRRVCEIVCRPEPAPIIDTASEIRATSKLIASVIADKKTFAAIAKAALDPNCEVLKSAITAAGIVDRCEIICRLICSWRCYKICRELCTVREPVLTGEYGVEEARSFALAFRKLASQPRALGDLVSAVEEGDANAYSEIVDRFRLWPYCRQICAWVCTVTCHDFCFCVCPPSSGVIPLFTNVGEYKVEPSPNDFNANGTTVSGALAFTGIIPLIGIIPDGTAPQQLEYRFTYQDYSGISPNPNPVVPITASMIPPTQIGVVEYQFWNGTAWQLATTPYYVHNPGAPPLSITQEFGSPLSVTVDSEPDSDGWIELPTGLDNNAAGASGLFVPLPGTLILLDTTQLTSETFDLTGASAPPPELEAGATVPPAALSSKPVFQINFEARTVVTLTPVGGNSLNAIAMSNTEFEYIRHPEWPGSPLQSLGVGDGTTISFAGTLTAPVSPGSVEIIAGAVTGTDNGAGAISGAGVSGAINYTTGVISVTFTVAPAAGVQIQADYPVVTKQPLVLSVDVLELKDAASGCTELNDTIHALYTAYHPYLGSCEVFLQGPDVATMTVPPGGIISPVIQPNQGQVIGSGNGTAVNFTGTLTVPVLPGSVRINAGGVVGTDNGAGVIAGAGISAGSINYATGAVSVTFSAAPAVAVQVLVDYDTNVSSGAAGSPFDMTGLPPCAYILWLNATLNLTNGYGQIGGTYSDWIAFCTNAGQQH